jgi:hypothetical protein
MNIYNRAKNTVHERDLYDYKFRHSWSKRKKINTRNIRAKLKSMMNEE